MNIRHVMVNNQPFTDVWYSGRQARLMGFFDKFQARHIITTNRQMENDRIRNSRKDRKHGRDQKPRKLADLLRFMRPEQKGTK